MSAKTRPDETTQREADALIDLAQRLERAALDTRRDAAALRAQARGLRPGDKYGLLPGWGYDYAKMRLYALDKWRDEEPHA